jgi:hypothetical protein
MTNAHRILVVKCESRVPLGRSTQKGQANIRLDVKEIRYEMYTGRKLIQDKVQCWYFVKNIMILQVSFLYELWEITTK